MSMYNMVNGCSPAVFLILPMLGKHPEEYPRFRDCFLSNEERPDLDDHIHIYTRTGGGNREEYDEENEAMTNMDDFVEDFDDSFDTTYASWVFKVPEQWNADFKLITQGRMAEVSDAYVEQCKSVFPKIADQLESIFRPSGE